ncbi:hypothetical protein BASA81_000234 [Batrachochytrium salamandrivorans]|nr:hypothetical protein BASA81_000234 [Batrachochytrium salamandrivorans]
MAKLPKLDLTCAPGGEVPFGFVKSSQLGQASEVTFKINEQQLLALKNKRAMDMGIAPGKSLFMTAFMMWMAGAGVHIFSIMIVGMGVITPIKAITQTQTYFIPAQGEGVDLTIPKLAYVGLNFMGLFIALYKCSTMGLLPLSSTDWVSLLEVKQNLEFSGAI